MWWFYLIILLLSLFYLWFKNRYSYWERLGFPSAPGKIPLGSLGLSFVDEHNNYWFHRKYEEFKNKAPAFGIYFFNIRTLIPTDLELIKEILVKSFDSFHDRGFNFNEAQDPLLANIFNASGEKWKDLRAKMAPSFTTGRIKSMFPIISLNTNRLIDYLQPFVDKGEAVEMKELFQQLSVEIITSTAFGIETKCLGEPSNKFLKIALRSSNPPPMEGFLTLFAMSFGKIFNFLRLQIIPMSVTEFFIGVLGDSIMFRERNEIIRHDFFQLMVNLMKNPEIKLTPGEMAANCYLFFTAGFGTTSSAMTFLAYELALNPNIQERLRDEIEEVLERYEGDVSNDSISEMKYLDMVFNETLRKWPVANIQLRKATEDFKVPNSNLKIPKGTFIIIPVYGIHRDERFYDDPEKFDPERFNDKNKKKIKPMSYIPFSEGPRECIGSRFAITQIKIITVKLLRKYRLGVCEKTIDPMVFYPESTLLSPKGGMWLKLENL